jgi:hypothetical protein
MLGVGFHRSIYYVPAIYVLGLLAHTLPLLPAFYYYYSYYSERIVVKDDTTGAAWFEVLLSPRGEAPMW